MRFIKIKLLFICILVFSNPVFSQIDVVNNDLLWSDEFNGSGAIDSSNWFQQTQLPDGNNWYNGELQHYTNRQTNSFQNNGSLNLVAKKETFTDQGVTKQYTSARLNSKFAFKYGRVEVRAKLPSGVGTWPAIWMLGKNIIEPGGFGLQVSEHLLGLLVAKSTLWNTGEVIKIMCRVLCTLHRVSEVPLI